MKLTSLIENNDSGYAVSLTKQKHSKLRQGNR